MRIYPIASNRLTLLINLLINHCRLIVSQSKTAYKTHITHYYTTRGKQWQAVAVAMILLV